jgi:hypothetical protein
MFFSILLSPYKIDINILNIIVQIIIEAPYTRHFTKKRPAERVLPVLLAWGPGL